MSLRADVTVKLLYDRSSTSWSFEAREFSVSRSICGGWSERWSAVSESACRFAFPLLVADLPRFSIDSPAKRPQLYSNAQRAYFRIRNQSAKKRRGWTRRCNLRPSGARRLNPNTVPCIRDWIKGQGYGIILHIKGRSCLENFKWSICSDQTSECHASATFIYLIHYFIYSSMYPKRKPLRTRTTVDADCASV